MNNKNILISGAGIAGTTLAFWLSKFGFQPTIVELAPELRTGGYAIDFMGAGYTVAERMGIIPSLNEVAIPFTKLVFVDSDNHTKGSMNYQGIKNALDGRALTLLRSDLAKVIYQKLDADIEIIFGNTIISAAQNENEVTVTFKDGVTRNFNLLVGADGLHSIVRNLFFGNESQFEKYLGYYTSSYTIDNFPLDKNAFCMYNVPCKQVAVYSDAANKTTTFFIFTSSEKLSYNHSDIRYQKQCLSTEFENEGWKCKELLNDLESCKGFYFDSVSQIKMDTWCKGRVALVGDAGYCPSLLSGKGSTLAMVGAYILAGELKKAGGDYIKAFEEYELKLKPFMHKKQESARSFAKSFVPKSQFGIWLRNKVFGLMSLSFVSRWFLNQFKDSSLKLEVY